MIVVDTYLMRIQTAPTLTCKAGTQTWMCSPLDIQQLAPPSQLDMACTFRVWSSGFRVQTWMYSPLDIQRLASPSHFDMAVNTTVRAGMFSPIANVSVANSTWSGQSVHDQEPYQSPASISPIARTFRCKSNCAHVCA